MSKDKAYLADILRAAEAIGRFVAGIEKEGFIANEQKYEAVNRKFEIIGEAARHLSPETRSLFPDIPWRLISAMRNILIHNYDDVDLDIVWDTTQKDIPNLALTLREHFNKLPPEEP